MQETNLKNGTISEKGQIAFEPAVKARYVNIEVNKMVQVEINRALRLKRFGLVQEINDHIDFQKNFKVYYLN